MHPLITVCVPVYQAANLVAETLASIQQQSYEDISVLVSVDHGRDNSEQICRAFESDPRFTVMAQAQRLGWAVNVNFLLDRVNSEFFAYLSHDDLWHKDYLKILLELLRQEKNASVAYSDLERFGMRDGVLRCRSYRGSAFERVREYLAEPFHPVPLRGLIRSASFEHRFRLREYGFEGILAERLGVFEILNAGQGLHWPKPLCRKRVVETSASRGWVKWSNEKKLDAWTAHSAAFIEVIQGADFSVVEKQMLVTLLPQHIASFGDAMRNVLRTSPKNV